MCRRDIGVGEFGGERVAQPVDECATGAVGVDAGVAKSAQHPVLQGAAGDPLTVGTHEQRRRRRPGGQSLAGGALSGCGGESGRPAVEIVREDLHQRRFDRDAAVLAAFPADVDDGAVVGAAEVTEVGAQQFVGAQAGEQRGENEGAVTLNPVGASPRLGRNFGDVFVGAFSLGGRRQLGVLVGGDAVQ
jgi:hypothetical protein